MKPMVSTPRKTIIDQKPNQPISESDGPGKQERHFEVEDDEQDRHEVEADVELHAGVVEGVEAALVGESFSGSGFLIGDEERGDEQGQADASARPMKMTIGR
jgi:hypothetical protein